MKIVYTILMRTISVPVLLSFIIYSTLSSYEVYFDILTAISLLGRLIRSPWLSAWYIIYVIWFAKNGGLVGLRAINLYKLIIVVFLFWKPFNQWWQTLKTYWQNSCQSLVNHTRDKFLSVWCLLELYFVLSLCMVNV